MTSLPTYSMLEMAGQAVLERAESSPSSSHSADNNNNNNHNIHQHSHYQPSNQQQLYYANSVPTISVATLPNLATVSPHIPLGAVPISIPLPMTPDAYGWLPSPASSNFGFQSQPSYPFEHTINNSTAGTLGFASTPDFTNFNTGYHPHQNYMSPQSVPLPTSTTFRPRTGSTCANPLDVFGLMTPSLPMDMDNDIEEAPSAPATNLASPISSSSPEAIPAQIKESSDSSSTTSSNSSSVKQIKKDKKGAAASVKHGAPNGKIAPLPIVIPTEEEAVIEHIEIAGTGSAGGSGPKKRSRTAQACERCRFRKARCFGGNPCNRCIKRKFVCEFTPTRQRGPNKPRSPELTISHPHPHHPVQHPALPHSHASHGAHGHTHPAHSGSTGPLKTKARRHSTPAAVSSIAPLVGSSSANLAAIRPKRPHPATIPEHAPLGVPTVGLGLELTTPPESSRDDADEAIDMDSPESDDGELIVPEVMISSISSAPPLLTPSQILDSARHHHHHGHAHHGHGHSIGHTRSNSVIGSGWSMISGGGVDLYSPFADEDNDMFSWSPNGSGTGSGSGDQGTTLLSNLSVQDFDSRSNTGNGGGFEFPFTPNSPLEMGLSNHPVFGLSNDGMGEHDHVERGLFGSALTTSEEWYGMSS